MKDENEARAAGAAETTSFSEGPWSVGRGGGTFWLPIVDGRGCYICAVTERTERSEAEANARLIAAAPDLLSALERLRSGFKALLSQKPVRDVAETLGEVDAAIRKATAANRKSV